MYKSRKTFPVGLSQRPLGETHRVYKTIGNESDGSSSLDAVLNLAQVIWWIKAQGVALYSTSSFQPAMRKSLDVFHGIGDARDGSRSKFLTSKLKGFHGLTVSG